MTHRDRELEMLMERADNLLTDSNHPLDPKQSAEVTLLLIQQIVNMSLTIQRELADLRVNLLERRAVLDERVGKIEKDVTEIKNTMRDYPSITWLLRYRFSTTSKTIVAVLMVVYLIARNYAGLAAWFGLPPLP